MIVLDTNVISELMTLHPAKSVQKWLNALNESQIGITSITISEIHYGLHRLPEGRRRNALFERFISLTQSLEIFVLDESAAAYTGVFRALRENMGLPSTPSDMMIAGIVASVSASLATRNTRDFLHLPITIINPWEFD